MFRKDYQSGGLGTTAISEGLKIAVSVGCNEAVTEYIPLNKAAAGAYEKAGYEISRIEVVKKLGDYEMNDNQLTPKILGGSTAIVKITADMYEKYHDTLADYYYKNMKSCAFTDGYTQEEANEKINELASYIREEKAFVFGCLFENELIGYVWSYLHKFREEQRIYVSEIHVSEEWRSHGIGRSLLQEVEKEAKANNIKALYIHVEAGNEVAIRLYESEGFKLERVQLRKAL